MRRSTAMILGKKLLKSILPSEYKQLDYIESTGIQYIDTGFAPNQDTRVVCDFQLTEVYSSFVFGARRTSGGAYAQAYTFNMGGGGFFVTTYYSSTAEKFSEIDLLRHTVDKNKNVTTFDNASITSSYVEFTAPKTLAIFACNQGDRDGYLPSKMKLYSCQMYDNGTLIRDFVPCYRKSNGEVGLYDTVSKSFFGNKGTGTFLKGNDVR
jgi:hypothetical protein